MTTQVPVQVSQQEPVCTHAAGVQGWPAKKMKGAVHWLLLATAKHAPVAGLQHAPPLGKQLRGVHAVPVTTVPPAIAHAAGSRMWQSPQQQQTETGPGQLLGAGKATAHELPMEDVPPIWAQVPALTTVQVPPLTQHAPGPSPAHWAAVQGIAPVKVPPLRTQSQLDACTQLPLRQQKPKTGVVGQMPGWQAAPGK